MEQIETVIAESEQAHSGEIRVAVEVGLPLRHLLRGVSARQRAVEVFSQQRIWDTEANNGVLIYLLLADRSVEIIADRGLLRKLPAGMLDEICQRMEADFKRGDFRAGIQTCIGALHGQLVAHFPARDGNRNELPDSPIEL
jgi:uncharacterized membrane protein